MSAGRVVIEGFHRTGPDNRSVSFSEGICDVSALLNYLRTEQRVFGSPDADPIVLLLDEGGHEPGNCMGTVSMRDDDHKLVTIERAIRMLESVRDGLLETGHHDWEGESQARQTASPPPQVRR